MNLSRGARQLGWASCLASAGKKAEIHIKEMKILTWQNPLWSNDQGKVKERGILILHIWLLNKGYE